MSLAHIRLVKVTETESSVVYEGQTPDFSNDRTWESVSKIVLRKDSDDFSFTTLGYWADKQVVPPNVYALPPEELERALSGPYMGHGFGAWTGRMLSRIRRIREMGRFPDCV